MPDRIGEQSACPGLLNYERERLPGSFADLVDTQAMEICKSGFDVAYFAGPPKSSTLVPKRMIGFWQYTTKWYPCKQLSPADRGPVD